MRNFRNWAGCHLSAQLRISPHDDIVRYNRPMTPVDSYSTLFNYNLPVGIALFSIDLNLLRHNESWCRYTNGVSAEINGQHLSKLLPAAFNTLQPLLIKALAEGPLDQPSERLSIANDIVFWDITINPQHDVAEQTSILLIVNDVTEQVLATQLLERRVTDRTRKLSALYDVMEVAAEPLPVKEILEESLRRVLMAVHGSGGAIQIFDDAGEKLYLAAHRGIDVEVIERLEVTAGDAGLSGWTAEHDETLVLADLNKDRRAPAVLRDSDLTVYVGVPMSARGNVVGVLNAFRESRRPFSPEDISLLTSVGDQIAVAVENARLRLDNERLLIVEERNRLARELHDAVTQSLYSLVLFSGATKRQIERNNQPQSLEFIHRVEQTGQQALKEMRLLVHNLRPDVLEQAGLERAIRQRLDAVEGRANIKSALTVSGTIALPSHVEEALYQLTQEALNNSLKHSNARHVIVRLEQRDDTVRLRIQDDGVGFDLESAEDNGGLGLTSMRERIELLNGSIDISSESGEGTTINITINLAAVGAPVETLEIVDLI